MERVWIAVAGLSGVAAVGADAAAAHLLAALPVRLGFAATAARYGLVHAVALVGLALMLSAVPAGAARLWLMVSGWCFVAAILLFCGTLYLQAAGFGSFLTPLVPAGGVLFIAGWAALFLSALTPRRPA